MKIVTFIISILLIALSVIKLNLTDSAHSIQEGYVVANQPAQSYVAVENDRLDTTHIVEIDLERYEMGNYISPMSIAYSEKPIYYSGFSERHKLPNIFIIKMEYANKIHFYKCSKLSSSSHF